MPNEFIIKNGFRSQGNSQITGSLSTSGSSTFTGGNYLFKGAGSGDGGIQIGNTINGYTGIDWISNNVGFGLIAGGGITTKVNSGMGFNVGTSTTTSLGAMLGVKGSGTTSATTALLVQNANATNMLSLTDNGALTVNTFQTSSTALTINRTNSTMGGSFNLATMGTLINIQDTVGNSNSSKTTIYIASTGASTNNAAEIYGGVGIGTAPNGPNFYVGYNTIIYNTARVLASSTFGLSSRSSISTYDAGNGGGISFWGDDRAQGLASAAFGGIRGIKENSTYVNSLGNLAFYVQSNSGGGQTESTFLEAARFNSSGNFGLGTSTPSAKVHISGSSGSALLEIDSPAVNNILYVSGSGNVGIGTGTPSRTLEVYKSGLVDGSIEGLRITTQHSSATAQTALEFYHTYGSSGLSRIATDIGNGGTNPSMYFVVNGTTIMKLANTGNVQIGTTTDAGYRLDVNGTARFVNTISYNGNLTPLNASTYSLGLSSSVSVSRIINYTNNGLSPIQSLEFGFYNTSLNSDGGFSNPTHNNYAFRIYGNYTPSGTGGGTMSSFRIEPTLNFAGNANVGTYRGIWYNPTLTNLTNTNHIAIETVTGNVLFGTTSGNVAIGTTTPSASLHISGASSAALLEIDSPAANNILFVTGSGNVGINTNTPLQKLHVNGNGVFGPGTSGESYIQIKPGRFNGNNQIIFNDFDGGIGSRGGFIELGTYYGQIRYGNYNWFYIGDTTNAYKFYIAPSTGNVIITNQNTQPTDAGYKLDVNGNTRIQGNTTLTGTLTMGNGSFSYSANPNNWFTISGNQGLILNQANGNNGSIVLGASNSANFTVALTNTTMYGVSISRPVTPIAGSTNLTYNSLEIDNVINYTNATNSIVRGLYIHPTLTSVTDFRAIETTVGNVLFGTTSGNVGIGTTSPAQKLDVSAGHITTYDTSAKEGKITFNNNASALRWDQLTQKLHLTVATRDKLTIDNNGLVGINQISPSYQLDVSGSINTNTGLTVTGSLNLNGSDISSSWISYTPTWTTDSTQPTLGDGSLTGAYKVVGKTCFVRVRLVWGTTTNSGTGAFYFDLPVTASSTWGIQMPASILDNGNAWYQATVNGEYGGFTTKTALIGQSAGGANSSQGITGVFPFTFGDLDSIQFNGSYEIA